MAIWPHIRGEHGKTSTADTQSRSQGEGGSGRPKREKTLAKVAQQYDVHPNQITDRKARLTEGAAGLCGGPPLGAEPAPAVDVKLLHA